MRVLYIAGTGRSGSTLLASILGQAPGFFNAGELRYIWQRGIQENRLCGCGRRFADCPFWREVVELAGLPDAAAMAEVQARLTRIRHLPRMGLDSQSREPAIEAYRAALGRLYRAVAHVSNSQVVVDSSKLPSYGRVLATIPDVDLYTVQLVRDPRAAATSWASLKVQPDRGVSGVFMQRLSPTRSALLWAFWNAIAGGLVGNGPARYLTLRYEDLIARPLDSVRRITELVGEGQVELPFRDARTVELAANHTVAGNPDRLSSGLVTIRTGAASDQSLSKRDRLLVTALTLPVLVRFGYPLAFRKTSRPTPIGIQHLPGPVRTLRRIQRHWQWGRQEGFGRLIEEDQLDPRARLAVARRRREWRREHVIAPGTATPVFLVGLQRSGTNMVARALESNPEFEVRNENDRQAFDRFRLRPLPVIRDLVMQSRQRFLVLKPLIDSHRVDELLRDLETPSHPRALWTYRSMEGRTRSAVAKFGDQSLQVLRAIRDGRGEDLWQAQGMTPAARDLIRTLDLDAATPETAAAVLWYVRNALFFELGLDASDDCLLISYDRLLSDPERELQRVCRFLGAEFDPAMAVGIGRRSKSEAPIPGIDPLVRMRCSELERRLEEACSTRVQA